MEGNTVQRYDALPFELASPERLDSGYLRVQGVATRTGVFEYSQPDGSVIRELRHPDDVFDVESLNTLKGTPLTNEHVAGGVNPDNARTSGRGAVHSVLPVLDSGHVAVSLDVWDGATQGVIERGKQALSCGYRADIVPESGEWEGQPYDQRQTRIRYNHLALVARGRAGEVARLRMDGNSVCPFAEDGDSGNHPKEQTMSDKATANVRLDGADYTLDASVAQALSRELASVRADGKSYEDKYKELKDKYDALKEAYDEMKAKEDGREDSAVPDVAALNAYARERADMLAFAAKREVKLDSADELDNAGLKRAIVCALRANASERNDSYIEAAYDLLVESAPNESHTRAAAALLAPSGEAERADSDAAYREWVAKQNVAASK